jgi:hypothetical protein
LGTGINFYVSSIDYYLRGFIMFEGLTVGMCVAFGAGICVGAGAGIWATSYYYDSMADMGQSIGSSVRPNPYSVGMAG